jgi:hypothetical protein
MFVFEGTGWKNFLNYVPLTMISDLIYLIDVFSYVNQNKLQQGPISDTITNICKDE